MFSATKSMAGAMCINVVDSSQEVCCPIHPGITNWKNLHSIAGGKRGREAAGKQQASSGQAAGKQQASSNQHLPRWKNDQIYLKKINAIKKKWTFSRRTAPKRRNRSITKSCGDAKIELFPGARPTDTTFTSWYDLTLALVFIYIYSIYIYIYVYMYIQREREGERERSLLS